MKSTQGPKTPSSIKQTNSTTVKGEKSRRMLGVFIKSGEKGLNKLEAFKIGDTCLSQTVEHFQNNFNLFFRRESEEIKNRFLGRTIFTRYWLEGDELERAKKLLKANEES